MKKLFTILAVAATLVSCAKEDVVREAAREAIGFDNAFVENSTRSVNDPSFDADIMFSDFAVFGFVEGATLFDGAQNADYTRVAKANLAADQTKTGWEYAGTQYWIAGANYDFYAVAPYTGDWAVKADTTPASTGAVITFTNEDGTQDLLYSGIVAQEGKVSGNANVGFTFKHILSKVKFSFENGYNASNATIKVKDVVITDAYSTANVNLNDTTVDWTDHNGTITNGIAFGAATDDESTAAKESADVAYACNKTYESYYERFLIPSDSRAYNVSFVVELYINDTLIDVNSADDKYGYEHTATITFAPEAGHAYDIKAVINAKNIDPNHAQEPIEFTVTSIDGWGTTNNEEADGDYDPTPQQ